MDYYQYAVNQGWELAPPTLRPNLFKMPLNKLHATVENSKIINELYFALKSDPDMCVIDLSPSGGLSYRGLILPAYNIKFFKTMKGIIHGMEIVVLLGNCSIRVQFSSYAPTNFSGHRAYFAFRHRCQKEGIDLDSFAVSPEEGIAYKERIPKPMIFSCGDYVLDREIENCHHIDYRSSYGAGLANTHPALRPVVEYFFKKRMINDNYKQIPNLTIGYFQSSYLNYRFANLAYDAIRDNNLRVKRLASKVVANNNRIVLLYNTDGFWYTGSIYDGEGSGSELGQWHHDHVNCKLRIKSDGAYEFIEDGQYYPVIRGSTNLDKIKPRSEWEWGDIYRRDTKAIMMIWTDEGGFSEFKK